MSIIHHKDLVRQIKDRKKILSDKSKKSKGPNKATAPDRRGRAT